MRRHVKSVARHILILFIVLAPVISLVSSQQPPPVFDCAREPVKYIGDRQPDKRFYDGALPHAVGVHHYQVLRANRSRPSEGGEIGWTYNHQPFLAYWNGRFYAQYLSTVFQEHTPPGRTLLSTSEDGRNWTNPVVIFPEYALPEIKTEDGVIPAGTKAVMHQRMGFYVAPSGRLLTLAFYGYCLTPRHSPNAGNGLGRVVREIKKDGSLGPIYFIRYNLHAGFNESNTAYPFYKKSPDPGFLEACEALLADKLVTLQWWEEDRGKDGFFAIDPGDAENAAYFSSSVTTSKGAGKAFCYYHRPDGVVVGLWKNQYSALSPDNGQSWTRIALSKTLWTCGAKVWAQRTDDGRYALVHNQSATRRNRFPMVVMTSSDGHIFDDMLCVRGEVPPKRYQGIHKNTGPQYYRGIVEGNGNPPGDDMWVTYSVNKEDIWVARMRVPITWEVKEPFSDDFEQGDRALDFWNLQSLKWAPVEVVAEKGKKNKCLELLDEEPYDYALAERVFPRNRTVSIRFRFNAAQVAQGHALEVEVQDQQGTRPLRLRIDRNWLGMDHKHVDVPPVAIQTGKWHTVELKVDCGKQSYDVIVDQAPVRQGIPFAEATESVERLVFRTGPYRGFVPPEIVDAGMPSPAGLETEDLPGADEKSPTCRYLIDDVKVQNE
ncbi:MAG: hypothetical protein EHM23_25350 [Acidobacteria bacterium]|nr:MAG: hypothetical protein EHM23_25350 [Acidobacteriota bacterium]